MVSAFDPKAFQVNAFQSRVFAFISRMFYAMTRKRHYEATPRARAYEATPMPLVSTPSTTITLEATPRKRSYFAQEK